MDEFSHSGPSHLKQIDWDDAYCCRAVVASLVNGAYVMERDRQTGRQGSQALAPPWWEFFNFELCHVFADEVHSTIFGAVYKSVLPDRARNGPAYVVALRGMMLTPATSIGDSKLVAMCIASMLHRCSRFKYALGVVEHLLHSVRAANVWLAGHALGAAILVLVGKKMARKNFPLKTYLYNPPFVTAPLGRIKDHNLRDRLMILARLLKAATVAALNPPKNKPLVHDNFEVLSSWEPNLFVNPEDYLCSGYISYFELRTLMKSIGAGKIERIAMQNSLIKLAMDATGKDSEAESVDTLPSACLTTNLRPSPDFRRAHGVEQWWDDRTECRSVLHRFLPKEMKFEMIEMPPGHTQRRRGRKVVAKL